MAKTDFVAEGGVVVTRKLLDEWAEPYEQGIMPGISGGFVPAPGRPPLGEGESKVVSLRLPVSVINAADKTAAKKGQSRSQFMRSAIIASIAAD